MFSDQQLKKLIIPLVIEQILAMFVGIADVMMVSYAGEAAISGVALMDMFSYMIITILTAFATGGSVVISQYLGNKDKEKAGITACQSLTINFLISMTIMVICLLFNATIIRLFFGSIDADVMRAASVYFYVTAISFPFLGIYNASSALYRSLGKTDTTMYVSILMNTINIVGNAIGVFILKAGVMGVAVPTLVSRIVAGMVLFVLAFNKNNEAYFTGNAILAWKKDYIFRVTRIAVPNGIENGLFALGRVLVTGIVALFGTTQIAANGVANSIGVIAIIVVNAMNVAMITIVGQCVGADEYEQAKYYTKKLMKISYISTAVLGGLVCLFITVILDFYELSAETYNLSMVLIIIHNILATLLHPTSFNLPNSLRAAGDVKFTMYVGIGSMIIFRLGSAVLFGIIFNMGIIGVWIAMGMDWSMRSVAFTLRYKSGKWKEFRAI